MTIETIQDPQTFAALRPTWDSVYHQDPKAHFFSSWAWRDCFHQVSPFGLYILAFHPEGQDEYAAFMPLTVQRSSRNLITTLHMGNYPLVQYCGFVCLPQYEQQAIREFAQYLKQNQLWDRLKIRFALDERLDDFLAAFGPEDFTKSQHKFQAPVMQLPDSWDGYLMECLSSSTRRSVRRSLKKIAKLSGYHVSEADKSNIDQHIEIMLDMYRERWGNIHHEYDRLLPLCFEHGFLWMSVLWQGDTPIAAVSNLMDDSKGVFLGLIQTYNIEYNSYSPGIVAQIHSIQYAIEHGYHTYDFLSGDESYKYTLGAQQRQSTSALIIPKTIKNRASMLVRKMKRLATRETLAEWDD